MPNTKTQLPAHIQHRCVLLQDLAFDGADTFGTGIFDQQLHQHVAEAVPLQVGTHEDCLFALVVIGVRMQTNDSK